MTRIRHWIWHRLVFLADRIAPDLAFRCTGFTYTFERGIGVVLHERGDRGCLIWYRGPDHDKAHTEAIDGL